MRAQPPQVFLRREADGRLALGVRDFGPGVPDNQIQRLSEAFYRPDSARTRAAGGVGLGLYLCRLVAQAHGGGPPPGAPACSKAGEVRFRIGHRGNPSGHKEIAGA
jgi:signal transduction histidine kinase